MNDIFISRNGYFDLISFDSKNFYSVLRLDVLSGGQPDESLPAVLPLLLPKVFIELAHEDILVCQSSVNLTSFLAQFRPPIIL